MKNINKQKPILIVMLTYNDHTIKNACEIFDECKNSKAEYWGFKEEGISCDEMKKLFKYMKDCGKTTVLEVVAYTEDKCLQGAKTAVECGCDILMGTVFFDSVYEICKKHGIKYLPFVGKVSKRPSILEGDIADIINEANLLVSKGVSGFDLLGYRHTENPTLLNKSFVSAVDADVCIAGSVDSYKKIDEIIENGAWAFTIGGAFFDKTFGENICEQIDRVATYIEES